ncbi:MAG: metallophosphoesterase [Clostridia bacterium]|nr:metallophosphoesterase [Clostridia bacterium]
MRIAVMSDIHLFRKTDRIRCALKAAAQPDALLIAGDLTDRAQTEQFDLLHACIQDCLGSVPVYAVAGNHDNPARDDAAFRAFERSILAQAQYCPDGSGAFFHRLCPDVDIIGLNPVYHQKMFFFPERGKQLCFLESVLEKSEASHRIVLCHPPLLAHNPLRAVTPYITIEQDARLQRIIDGSKHVIFISGHTHTAPAVEMDALRNNIYINDGSICPTATGNPDQPTQQGNITILNTGEHGMHISIQGIHTGKTFFSACVPSPDAGQNQML